MGAVSDTPLQGFRRTFAKYLAVFDREPAQFHKAEKGGDLCYRRKIAVGRQKRAPRLRKPLHPEMAAGGRAVDRAKCLAQRALADGEGAAESRNVEPRFGFCEGDLLGLVDEIVPGSVR